MAFPQIPTIQLAAVLVPGPKRSIIFQQVPVIQPSDLEPGQCLVKMICTGVCHSDLHISNGDWPELQATLPLICGHEGVGEIVAIADHTEASPVKLRQRVGIKLIAYSCRGCEQCRTGLEQNCRSVKLGGFSIHGTFCQYVVSWVHNVTPISDNIDPFAAAPLLCAGVTVYRALKHSGAKIGNWVVIPGAGGGLGHLAVQYAVAMGTRVVAIVSDHDPTDSGEEKKKLCLELGAEKWIDFTQTADIVEAIKDTCDGLGAHCAIIAATRSECYSQAVGYLRPGGTLMAVGVPANAVLNVSIFWTVIKNITIKGTAVGNHQDSIEAIEIASSGKVKVKYTVKGLMDLQQVYDDLESGNIIGRVVLDVSR